MRVTVTMGIRIQTSNAFRNYTNLGKVTLVSSPLVLMKSPVIIVNYLNTTRFVFAPTEWALDLVRQLLIASQGNSVFSQLMGISCHVKHYCGL